MSLFQCQHCGCVENTALSSQGYNGFIAKYFSWVGIEDRQGMKLCSACGPTHYADGKPNDEHGWHGRFNRTFLPLGQFQTNARGNLEHIETHDEDYFKYAIPAPDLT